MGRRCAYPRAFSTLLLFALIVFLAPAASGTQISLPFDTRLSFQGETREYQLSPDTGPPLQITFEVSPDMITDQKYIMPSSGSTEGYYKTITRPSENAWFEVSVLNSQTGEQIMRDGYGKTYDQTTGKRTLSIYKNGPYAFQLSGSAVTVDFQAVSTGKPVTVATTSKTTYSVTPGATDRISGSAQPVLPNNVPSSVVIALVLVLVAGGTGFFVYRKIDSGKKFKKKRVADDLEALIHRTDILSSQSVDIEALTALAQGGDSAGFENALKKQAEKSAALVQTESDRITREGIQYTGPGEDIRRYLESREYARAIIASGDAISGIAGTRAAYAQAVRLKESLARSPALQLFEAGNYREFLEEGETILDLSGEYRVLLAQAQTYGDIPESIPRTIETLNVHQIREAKAALERFVLESGRGVRGLREQANDMYAKAEKFGQVPDAVPKDFDILDKGELNRIISVLEQFLATARPDLMVTLDTTRFTPGKWHKTGIFITNTGKAHASDVRFAFSEEVEIKQISPASVPAGQSARLDIGMYPKKTGSVPLEITAAYRDANDRSYSSTHHFWIDVVDSGGMGLTPGVTPATGPAAPFTPGPATQKQIPVEIADRYTEAEYIGKGGFARVFKAKRKDGHAVAVKIPISLDSATGKSFIAELQNWTRFTHENIVRVYDYNILPVPYFEMELCDSSLADIATPLGTQEAAWVIFNVCDGLKYAHAQRIIHRDLKPRNILLKDGVPKISDWGLSRVISESASTAVTSFTPSYAAPEQVTNRAKDQRTDIWQVGVILYELVTGTLPFTGESMVDVAMSIATKEFPRPSGINPDAREIEPVILKCLEKDPARRYQSVPELQKALGMVLRTSFAASLQSSISTRNVQRTAWYCGDLVIINLHMGDSEAAYQYLCELEHYAKGDSRAEVRELAEQIRVRKESGITEIPDELLKKAEFIIHKISLSF
jgi:hypothetical protein